jgi:hypothetical protein
MMQPSSTGNLPRIERRLPDLHVKSHTDPGLSAVPARPEENTAPGSSQRAGVKVIEWQEKICHEHPLAAEIIHKP